MIIPGTGFTVKDGGKAIAVSPVNDAVSAKGKKWTGKNNNSPSFECPHCEKKIEAGIPFDPEVKGWEP